MREFAQQVAAAFVHVHALALPACRDVQRLHLKINLRAFVGLEGVRPHLQAVPGVEPLRSDYNPATWMLEVSGGGAKMHTEAVKADFAQIYRDSAAYAETARLADEIAARSKAATEPLALTSQYAAPLGRQASGLLRKLFIVYWCASAKRRALRSSHGITAPEQIRSATVSLLAK